MKTPYLRQATFQLSIDKSGDKSGDFDALLPVCQLAMTMACLVQVRVACTPCQDDDVKRCLRSQSQVSLPALSRGERVSKVNDQGVIPHFKPFDVLRFFYKAEQFP